MKKERVSTDSLIQQLATEVAFEPRYRITTRIGLIYAVSLGLLASVIIALEWQGLRHDFPSALLTGPVLIKFGSSGLLIAGAWILASRLSQPFKTVSRWWLWLVPSLLILLSALWLAPKQLQQVRMMGPMPMSHNSLLMKPIPLGHGARLTCLVPILADSLVPLCLILFFLRRGASATPALTGTAAGVLAGGIGLFAYSFHCPLVAGNAIVMNYAISVASVALLGTLIGRKILTW